MKILLLTLSALFLFAGCSAKEFNSGVNSVTSDISTAFENSKDKSAN